ncbi:DUF6255 family natural product biosynthesis protein [Streptomyces sp. NPDC029704]|uniref:DUF6255 family natural product biosynthesis protein n=1 Tax=Streptomyces TaxID=1883 RepID=UPI0033C0ED2B
MRQRRAAAVRAAFPGRPAKRAARCAHAQAAWTLIGGIESCRQCGTQRFADYRALALALELPERTVPSAPTTAGAGLMRRPWAAVPA